MESHGGIPITVIAMHHIALTMTGIKGVERIREDNIGYSA
jgi:hypothetical protein